MSEGISGISGVAGLGAASITADPNRTILTTGTQYQGSTGYTSLYDINFGQVGTGSNLYEPETAMILTVVNTILNTVPYEKRNKVRNGLLAVIPNLDKEETFQITHNLTTILTGFRKLPSCEDLNIPRAHVVLNTKITIMATSMGFVNKFDVYDYKALKKIDSLSNRLSDCFEMCASENHGDREIGVQLLLNMDTDG